jgi:hypothetical protein
LSSKEELSARINELLGLKDNPIAFEKLSKEELVRLCEAVENLALGGGLFGQKLLNKPLHEVMNMRLRDILREAREGRGLFGLGILSRLLEERKYRVQKEQEVQKGES